jgi:hypothetical protein
MKSRKAGKELSLLALVSIGLAVVLSLLIVVPNYVNPPPGGKRRISAINACINNLRQIDGAKQQWLMATHAASNAIPTWEDIKPYLWFDGKQAEIPKCLAGGVYSIGAISNSPTCTIKGHELK